MLVSTQIIYNILIPLSSSFEWFGIFYYRASKTFRKTLPESDLKSNYFNLNGHLRYEKTYTNEDIRGRCYQVTAAITK